MKSPGAPDRFPDARPCRILVLRYRFIGDTVLAIPALRNLRRAFPRATIDVLAEPVSGETLAHCPHKDELLLWNPRARPGAPTPPGQLPPGRGACARALRARRYDRAYILRRSFSAAWLTFLARIPHRVGFSTQGSGLLLQRHTPYAERHEVECFLDVLRADGIPIDDAHNENWTDPAVDARLAPEFSLPVPRVFLCARSVFPAKDWEPSRFAALIDWLVWDRGYEVHLCDSPANAGYYDLIRAALPRPLPRPIVDWSTRLRIRDCGSLMRRMDLAVGIDTGLLHIAASFHVPVVALFGPLDPRRWHPWDTPHTILQPADTSGDRPLLRLNLAEVTAAIDALAARPRPSQVSG